MWNTDIFVVCSGMSGGAEYIYKPKYGISSDTDSRWEKTGFLSI